jgi:cell wall integrity and stress response component
VTNTTFIMTRSIFRAVALASAFAFLVSSVAAQDTTASPATTSTNAPKAITTLGCYQQPDPLTVFGDYTFQSSGWCQSNCTTLGKAVMAITGGSTCYCGDELPALDQEVDLTSCDSPCAGFGQQTCGGIGFWQVYLTGLTGNVETAPNSTSSTSATSTQNSGGSGSSTTAPAVVTKPGETIVVTQAPTAPSNQNKSSSSGGSNKVAIAVGVVVGILGVGAIIGGVLLYMRRRRNHEIEAEHRRNAAVSSFVGSVKSDKTDNDQRLDPSIYSHRRQSIGSIADERDFSRRILQVCCLH